MVRLSLTVSHAPEPGSDRALTGTYVAVLALEAVTILLLWALGRAYS
jgi:hypothetical protein